MSFEVKKEEPLDYSEYENFHDEHNEENSIDFGSCISNPPSSSKTPSKSHTRLVSSSTLKMPSLDEIMVVKDLNWRIALQRHKTQQELTNDSRTKIAKVLIKNIYERKFKLDGNYDLKCVEQTQSCVVLSEFSFQDENSGLSVFSRHGCVNFPNRSRWNLLL